MALGEVWTGKNFSHVMLFVFILGEVVLGDSAVFVLYSV